MIIRSSRLWRSMYWKEGHELDKRAKIVEMADSTGVRRIKEALIILSKDKNGKMTMNRDKGVELSSMWLDLV